MPHAAQTTSAGLRDLLERAGDDLRGAGRLHIFSLLLPVELDPLSLWALRPAEWAGCWETDDETWAGIGQTLSLGSSGADVESSLAAVETARRFGVDADVSDDDPRHPRLFGSIPFQPAMPDDDWGSLPNSGFVLPRWSLHRRRAGAGRPACNELQLALPDRPDRSEHDGLLQEFAGVEAGLAPDPVTRQSASAGRPHDAGRSERSGRSERDDWDAAIEAAIEEIRRGELDKVVLARRLDLRLDAPVTAESLLRRLRMEQAGRFRFGLRLGETAFVGASPECLFEKRGNRVTVEALAGTYDLGPNPEAGSLVRAAEHLFASGKDLEEHALVVRGIVEALRPLAISVEADGWPDVRAAGSLAHLSTAIAGELPEGVSAFDLIEALHPTPAVGGLPREAALSFIRRHEPVSRGLYAAPIGWLEPGGDACLAVGIRSALLSSERARVYAGAGIVAASDPTAEWEETGAKLRWFGELLGADS